MMPFISPAAPLPSFAPGSPLESGLKVLCAAGRAGVTVYLTGESGTGKEVLARYLHQVSRRAQGPFVAVNCAAIAPNLLEAELFGVVKGAFTGAHAHRLGRIRQAHGGLLFLDEIGDMPLEAQTRLLRVLQERRICPVGGDEEVAVDFDLVCATHRDLKQAVASGRFREDLYYRLNVVAVPVPALRDRPKDIPGLLQQFLSEKLSPSDVDLAMASLPKSLLSYAFPGNVRELRNLAERFVVFLSLGQGWPEAVHGMFATEEVVSHRNPLLLRSDFPNSRVSDQGILKALEECGWHRAQTAKNLGISRRTLQYRLARWN